MSERGVCVCSHMTMGDPPTVENTRPHRRALFNAIEGMLASWKFKEFNLPYKTDDAITMLIFQGKKYKPEMVPKSTAKRVCDDVQPLLKRFQELNLLVGNDGCPMHPEDEALTHMSIVTNFIPKKPPVQVAIAVPLEGQEGVSHFS